MLSRKSSTVEKSLASQPPGKKLVPTIAVYCFHQPNPTFQRPTVNEIITYKTTDRTTRLLAAPTRASNSRTGSGGQFSPGQPVCQQRSVASALQRPHLWCQKLAVVKAPPGSKGSPSAGQRVLSVFFSILARDSGSLQLCHLQRQETKMTARWQALRVRQTLPLLTILLFAPYYTIMVKKSKVGIRSVPISGNDQAVLLILPNIPSDIPHTETGLQRFNNELAH